MAISACSNNLSALENSAFSFGNFTLTNVGHEANESDKFTLLNRIAYLYITPVIIAFGILGDIMSILVLSHPLLRKNSVVYAYLLALAVTDLLTLTSVVPPILWIMKRKSCTYVGAYYYAHIGFPLANAFMGASVYIVVFLTLNQYIAVCHPFFHVRLLRTKRNCVILTALAYSLSFALYVPWAWKKTVRHVGDYAQFADCPYVACDNEDVVNSVLFKGYQWIREFCSRIVPFLLIAYFNVCILIVYRRTRTQRLDVVGLRQQKLTVQQKTEREERRLRSLLFVIMSMFFMCTVPAAPLTIMVSDKLESNFPFQIVRALTNVLEFTKFALNFYLYCMINPDIRRLCIQRLTCRDYGKAPMVNSRNSYNLSSLARMTEQEKAKRIKRKTARASQSTTPQLPNSASRSRKLYVSSDALSGRDFGDEEYCHLQIGISAAAATTFSRQNSARPLLHVRTNVVERRNGHVEVVAAD